MWMLAKGLLRAASLIQDANSTFDLLDDVIFADVIGLKSGQQATQSTRIATCHNTKCLSDHHLFKAKVPTAK